MISMTRTISAAADINYWVVEGNVGAVEKFTRNGGASIRARRIGSVLKEGKATTK